MIDFSWKSVDWQLEHKIRKYLTIDYLCLYWMDRDKSGYQNSEPNSIIKNLKISPEEIDKDPRRERYKNEAIDIFVSAICSLLKDKVFQDIKIAMVPSTTSKPRNHPNFNDALDVTAKCVADKNSNVFYEPICDIKQEMQPAHKGGTRDPKELAKNNIVTPFIKNTHYDLVILIDDVLTKGGHYRALHDKIKEQYPNTNIIGVFFALHIFSDNIETYAMDIQ